MLRYQYEMGSGAYRSSLSYLRCWRRLRLRRICGWCLWEISASLMMSSLLFDKLQLEFQITHPNFIVVRAEFFLRFLNSRGLSSSLQTQTSLKLDNRKCELLISQMIGASTRHSVLRFLISSFLLRSVLICYLTKTLRAILKDLFTCFARHISLYRARCS